MLLADKIGCANRKSLNILQLESEAESHEKDK